MAQQNKDITVTVRDAQLIWRNLEGRATMFKEAGTRSFNIVLDDEVAAALLAEQWNVKTKEPRSNEDEPLNTLEIAVAYKFKPPRVVLVTSNGQKNLGEDVVGTVDWVDIEKVDLIFRAYDWELKSGKSGRKAYLKTMFITINEDELEAEYGINDVASASVEDVRRYGQSPDGDEEPF